MPDRDSTLPSPSRARPAAGEAETGTEPPEGGLAAPASEVRFMNCQEFRNTVADTDPRHPHLAECPACAQRLDRQNQLRAGLRAMAGEWNRIQASPRIEEGLLAAFRAQAGTLAPLKVRRMPGLAWVAALAATLAIGVIVMRDRHQPKHLATAQNLESAALESTDGLAGTTDDGFVPLPGAAQLPPAEDVDLVRVELPRSAMRQIGIEVSPERASEKIQADVMVGADGLARSVRFVEASGSD